MAGFTTSALSAFTIEDKAELKTKAFYGSPTMDLFTVRDGIKYSEKLPYVTTDPAMKAYSTCAAISATGDGGTFGQITLTPDTFTFEQEWCLRDLESKFTQKYLKKGQKYDENSAPEVMNLLLQDMAGREGQKIGRAVWQASKTQGLFNTNFKQFNGFIQTLETLGGYVNQQTAAGTTYTSITVSNVLTIFQNQYQAIPDEIKDGEFVTVCGTDTFKKLVVAMMNANLFHYTLADAAAHSYEVTIPGINMKVKGLDGLNASNVSGMPSTFKNRIFTFAKDNFIVGTDLESDMDSYSIWYEKKDDKVYYRKPMKLTTGIFFADQVVSFATV